MNPCPVLPVVAWHSHRLNRGARREGSGPSQPPPTALETLSGSRCPTSSARLLETFARPTTLRTKLAQLGSQAATQIRTNSNPQAAAGPECLLSLFGPRIDQAIYQSLSLRVSAFDKQGNPTAENFEKPPGRIASFANRTAVGIPRVALVIGSIAAIVAIAITVTLFALHRENTNDLVNHLGGNLG